MNTNHSGQLLNPWESGTIETMARRGGQLANNEEEEHIMYAVCVATKNNPMDQSGKDHCDWHQTLSKEKYR